MAKMEWPSPRGATTQQKQAFAASLQELMAEKDISHIDLAQKLKVTPGAVRNPLMARSLPMEATAGRFARFFGVPVERMLTPKGAFTPYAGLRARKDGLPDNRNNGKAHKKVAVVDVATDAPREKRKYKKAKPNGHDTEGDPRWLLPLGVDPPHVKMETVKEQPSLNSLELSGKFPAHVAMALFSMANDYKQEPSQA